MRIRFTLTILVLAGCSSSRPAIDGDAQAPIDASQSGSQFDGSGYDRRLAETPPIEDDAPLRDDVVMREAAVPDASAPDDNSIDASDGSVDGSNGNIDGSRRGDGGPVTTPPWPESCVPARNLPNPAGEFLLTGPSGSRTFGEPAILGEAMFAFLNDFPRTFDRFQMEGGSSVAGHGYDGSIDISLPSLAPGTYTCPDVKIRYSNAASGGREFNNAVSGECCIVQVTRNDGVGGIIDGVFSGILINGAVFSWVKVEEGHFAVVVR